MFGVEGRKVTSISNRKQVQDIGAKFRCDVAATLLSLQLSSADGAKLSKSKISPSVGHFRGSEPPMYFNYPVNP